MHPKLVLTAGICILAACLLVKYTNCQTQCVPTCAGNEYCAPTEPQSVCAECDESCDGCHGAGPGQCKSCKLAYYLDPLGFCEKCQPLTFGVNCTGTCHCFSQDPDECAPDGECSLYACDWGWTDPPYCQKECEDLTYGRHCVNLCHCPEGDTCDPKNGLCSSGQCAPEWSGAGCQTRLPKLINLPDVKEVGCPVATIVWDSWEEDYDIGDPPIAQYDLYFNIQGQELWSKRSEHAHEMNKTYHVKLENLQPDAWYRFRVDVRRDNFGKLMPAVPGLFTDYVLIPCTVPTGATAAPTTAKPTTTVRPPGPHLLDRVDITTFSNGNIQIAWYMLSNLTIAHDSINVTLLYAIQAIGDCFTYPAPINVTRMSIPASGNFTIEDIEPWRVYIIQVVAESESNKIKDSITHHTASQEIVPTGVATNLQVDPESMTSTSLRITWKNIPCEERGGELDGFDVIQRNLNTSAQPVNMVVNLTSIDLKDLDPFTRYNVKVRYTNKKGEGPWSPETEFWTEEGVPGPPSIKDMNATTTSLTVTFNPPVVTNGIIRSYVLTYSTDFNFSKPVTVTEIVTEGFVYLMEISPLSPYTIYYIKMQASTGAGSGQYSESKSTRTLQDFPSAPVWLTLGEDGRNETCLNLEWLEPSETNGAISEYKVVFQEMGSVDSIDKGQVIIVENRTDVLICSLNPGRKYSFEIYAKNGRGYGPDINRQFTTEQAMPPPPPPPTFINSTYTTITIAIQPVILTTGPLTSYQILVKKVDNSRRKKRQEPTSTLPGYVTAEFLNSEIHQMRYFVVGDQKTYGGFVNFGLASESFYDIYYLINSTLEGITKTSFSKMETKLTTPPPVVSPEPEGSSSGVIIAIVVIIFLLLVACAIILVIWWYRRRQIPGLAYKPHSDEKHYDMTIYKSDYDPEKYWNKIYSLRESRFIVAGKKYLPDNPVTINGSAAVTKETPPMSFRDEFSNLPHKQLATWNAATERRNIAKNRFPHLLPYDISRVILKPDENSQSDYINASYIHGYKSPKAYIAAQSPFDDDTVLDFWRLIYQKGIKVVVMITNLVEEDIVKCTQYWPDKAGKFKYGTFTLELIETLEFADYLIRTIKVKNKGLTTWKIVYIFDFCSWPDHGVPDDPIPLLEMRHKVREYHSTDTSPLLVHCGTGVSRTGTFISIDSLLEQYEAEGRISTFSFVRKMRKDRIAMVRTRRQYIFIYDSIFDALVAGNTRVGLDLRQRYHTLTMKNRKTGHHFLHDQFACLQEFTRKITPNHCSHALLPANMSKNRFSEILPPDEYRPILVTPGGVGRTDYINAVFLDSHTQPDYFLVTQTPLHTTVIDFWKLVYDFDVRTIVMMENYNNEDDTCAEYWPKKAIKQFEPFFIETKQIFQQENVTIRHMKLTDSQRPNEPAREVRQFQFNAWTDPEFVPKSKSMLLDLIDLVHDWQEVSCQDGRPIIVHCKDGATHSGLFCAVSVICEKMRVDNEVDVFHTVKHFKRRRFQIIDLLAQYRFCYKTLWDYMCLRMPGGTLTQQMSQTKGDELYGVGSLSLTSYTSHPELNSFQYPTSEFSFTQGSYDA